MIAIVNLNADYEKLIEVVEKVGEKVVLTRDEREILKADKLIIPGSGVAYSAIKRLNLFNLSGAIKLFGKPILGISLGMEILCEFSDEGDVFCLGLIPGRVQKLERSKNSGPLEYFSSIIIEEKTPLTDGINPNDEFYFRHAYYVPKGKETVAVVSDKSNISAVIKNGNYYGVQFFPERSGEAGEKILRNFVEKC